MACTCIGGLHTHRALCMQLHAQLPTDPSTGPACLVNRHHAGMHFDVAPPSGHTYSRWCIGQQRQPALTRPP